MATTHGVVYVLGLQCMAPQRALPLVWMVEVGVGVGDEH